MGLIARQAEAAGIPTLCMTSALSITRSVNPPRAAFLDFPLGHTTGKAHEPALQREILMSALRAFESMSEPGQIEMLAAEWSEDHAWKDAVMRPDPTAGDRGGDDRVARRDTPQYQCDADRELAEAALARGGCEGCVFLEATG